jgi:hypothetical protein
MDFVSRFIGKQLGDKWQVNLRFRFSGLAIGAQVIHNFAAVL